MSGWQDSNLRPPGPKPGAITGLRYIPNLQLGKKTFFAERVGVEPTVQFNPYDDLANRSFRPLRHLSVFNLPLFKGQQKYTSILYHPKLNEEKKKIILGDFLLKKSNNKTYTKSMYQNKQFIQT